MFRILAASSAGGNITEFDGNLSVTVAYEGEYPVGVWRLAEDGSMEQVPSTFNSESGTVTFTTSTLSVFVIRHYVAAAIHTPAQAFTVPALRFAIGSTVFTSAGLSVIGDAAPFIDTATNRTMVPIRAIAEGLGAQVNWNETTSTVYITRGGEAASITIGTPLPADMGTAIIQDGRTFVPLRYVSEVLGADVRWDEINRAVYIY
jgi:hypothetical protein